MPLHGSRGHPDQYGPGSSMAPRHQNDRSWQPRPRISLWSLVATWVKDVNTDPGCSRAMDRHGPRQQPRSFIMKECRIFVNDLFRIKWNGHMVFGFLFVYVVDYRECDVSVLPGRKFSLDLIVVAAMDSRLVPCSVTIRKLLSETHGNKHRDPQLDNVQRLRDPGTVNPKQMPPSNPSHQYSRNPEEEDVERM
ncbi:hypothetical protein STEG23_009027 [Scotinomys teguina]